MNNKPGLIASYTAAAAIAAARFVKFGAADDQMVTATAGAVVVGVSDHYDVAQGERVDVAHTDIVPVTYGAAVARGDRVKSDATGRAIPIAAGDIHDGIAMVSGAAGEIGSVLLR